MKRYHFSLGDSRDGPVGFCAAVYAENPTRAVEKLQASLPEEQVVEPLESDEDGEVEYIASYFNPFKVSEADIDEEYEVCPKCKVDAADQESPSHECSGCGHRWEVPA